MKIGVLSDTHIPDTADKIPAEVFRIFEGMDLIIHAGDLTSLEVLTELNKIARVVAVCGNMDSWEVCQQLPNQKVVKVGKFSIGITHGRGHPDNLVDFVSKQFTKDIDVVIFGHSHSPFNEKRGRRLFLNPGSPTDKIFAPYNACGILEIEDGIKGKIIKLNDHP